MKKLFFELIAINVVLAQAAVAGVPSGVPKFSQSSKPSANTSEAVSASVALLPPVRRAGDPVTFDYPDATKETSPICATYCGTIPFDNNSDGTIVGFYTDPNVVPHAFLRKPDGQFISFDAPGAGLGAQLNEGTVAYGVNDRGAIVGEFQDEKLTYHAFIRDPDGKFTVVNWPDAGDGANMGTVLWTINREGDTGGYYVDSTGAAHGLLRLSKGETTTFDAPGVVDTVVCPETCLNTRGVLTGYILDSENHNHGFVRDAEGSITVFDPPGAVDTIAASINEEGVIMGYFVDTLGQYYGFLRSAEGAYTRIAVPTESNAAGEGASPFSINSSGTVVGEYFDSRSVTHGFSRAPSGFYVAFDAPKAGTAAGQGTHPATNNASGAVTGSVIDDINLNHGFLWEPECSSTLTSEPD